MYSAPRQCNRQLQTRLLGASECATICAYWIADGYELRGHFASVGVKALSTRWGLQGECTLFKRLRNWWSKPVVRPVPFMLEDRSALPELARTDGDRPCAKSG